MEGDGRVICESGWQGLERLRQRGMILCSDRQKRCDHHALELCRPYPLLCHQEGVRNLLIQLLCDVCMMESQIVCGCTPL